MHSGESVLPPSPEFDLNVVRKKISGSKVMEMKEPEVLSSTAIKLNWNVSGVDDDDEDDDDDAKSWK